jgi:hypothetical protein
MAAEGSGTTATLFAAARSWMFESDTGPPVSDVKVVWSEKPLNWSDVSVRSSVTSPEI